MPMRPVSILRPNGEKIPAHVIRFGPKNSRVTFNGDRDCSELVPTSQIFEVVEGSTKPPVSTGSSYVSLCTEVAAIDKKMEAALVGAGVIAAPHMNLQEKLEGLRGLRDDTTVVVEGELWSREDAEAAGMVEPSETHEEEPEAVAVP